MQAKPQEGERVHVIDIPDDYLSLRFFEGGLSTDRIFVFDFVDRRTKEAVNSPFGYTIEALPTRIIC